MKKRTLTYYEKQLLKAIARESASAHTLLELEAKPFLTPEERELKRKAEAGIRQTRTRKNHYRRKIANLKLRR